MKSVKRKQIFFYSLKIIFPKYHEFFTLYIQICYTIKNGLRLKVDKIPKKVIKNLVCDPIQDLNNCCLVSQSCYNIFSQFYGENHVVNLSVKGLEKSENRIAILYPTKLILDNTIYISETFYFNLVKSDNQNVHVTSAASSCPRIATKVLVSFVNNQLDVNSGLLERMLFNYFKAPKILYLNDLFDVSVKDTCPDMQYTKPVYFKYYFKCVKIYGSNNSVLDACFCVNGETELRLTHNLQSFVPSTVSSFKGVATDVHHLSNLLLDSCPFGYKNYQKELVKCIEPFLNTDKLPQELLPAFLIKGCIGSRKSLLVSSIAQKLGIHLLSFDCCEISSTPAVHTETKLRNVFLKCKLCSPCIVLLKNIQKLCLDSDGHEDPRLIAFFHAETRTLLTSNNYPIILICSAPALNLNSNLERIFLQIFTVESPAKEVRYEILRWLLQSKNINDEFVDLENIAQRTHSFVFGDLEFLVNQAVKGSLNCSPNQEQFLKILDNMQNDYSDSIGAPKIPKVYWEDIGGLSDIKREIIKTINYPIKYQKLLQNTSLKRSGLLLYGPPGTGKTLIAKAVATECGLHFLSIKGPELLNMYVGQSEANVRQVFIRAREAAPCIIFFDELDSLAPNRGLSGDSGGVMDRVVSQLLSEMDGLNENSSVFIIGATNRPDLIDPALLRPGRFDKLLYVGVSPDPMSKVQILKALTRKFNFKESLLKDIVKLLPENVTGADLQSLCSNAWLIATRRQIQRLQSGKKPENVKVELFIEDFTESVKLLKPSVTKESLMYYRNIQRQYENKML